MTKNEKQDLEALKIGFEMNEWEDFLLILNEIRSRDKEMISLYRKSYKKLIAMKRIKSKCTCADEDKAIMYFTSNWCKKCKSVII